MHEGDNPAQTNILIGGYSRPRLTDYGFIAIATDPDTADPSGTTSPQWNHQIHGTGIVLPFWFQSDEKQAVEEERYPTRLERPCTR